MQPLITVFCAFTREWAVDSWFEGFFKVDHDPARTNLCFIIDCNNPYILNKIKTAVEGKGYRSLFTQMNEEHIPNEVRVAVRRQRIAEVKNQSKNLVAQTDGEFVLSFEDDTVFDKIANFNRLLLPLIADPRVGFVEGVQCGRWGVKMVGAWLVGGNEQYGATKAMTLLPDEGYQDISGGGWYGYATPKRLYINCDYYTGFTQPWGPDVNYGLWLTALGYKSIVDWETVFGHRDFEKVLWPDASVTKIEYNKDINTGRWEMAPIASPEST